MALIQSQHGSPAPHNSKAMAISPQIDEERAPVDLEDAEEHEQRLTDALQTVRKQLNELLKVIPREPTKRTDEQRKQIAVLAAALKQIGHHQERLKTEMEYARQKRRELQIQQRKQAMVIHKPKAPPPIRMEELRALNQNKLLPEDIQVRTEQAQKARGIIPSGGLAGFRVAPDLVKMDFTDDDPNDPEKLEKWRPPK